MIIPGKTGSGMTEKSTLSFDDEADASDPEVAALIETGTFDGLIASVERECFAIMKAAGLPAYHGCFAYDQKGEWQKPRDPFLGSGLRIANEIWPIVQARGISEDSLIGFASRMLGDVVWLRRAREKGNHDRVAQRAFYLGVKRAELRIKTEHERVWNTGKKIHDSAPASRKRPQAERVAAVEALCARGTKITKAFAAVAADEGVTPKTIETDYYKAKRKRS